MKVSTVTNSGIYSVRTTNQTKTQRENFDRFDNHSGSINFQGNPIKDLYYYAIKHKNYARAAEEAKQIMHVQAAVRDDIGILSKRMNVPRGIVAEKYQADVDVAYGSTGSSIYMPDQGLNRVIGYSHEKLELVKNVVAPILRKTQEKEMTTPLPNGIILYGPESTGKKHMVFSLFDHLERTSPIRELYPKYRVPDVYYEPIKDRKIKTKTISSDWAEGDSENSFRTLYDTFIQAKKDAKNGDHTVIYIHNFEDLINSNNDLLQTELSFATRNSAENGFSWIGIVSDKTKLPEWVVDSERTSMIIPMKGMTSNAETSALLSHFISETRRLDTTNHDVIMDHMYKQGVPRYPSLIQNIVMRADEKLKSTKDYKSWQKNDYREHLRDEDLIEATDAWVKDNSEKTKTQEIIESSFQN